MESIDCFGWYIHCNYINSSTTRTYVSPSICVLIYFISSFILSLWKSESWSVVSDSLQSQCTEFGIPQARILEWVAFPFSRGSSWPRDWTQVSCLAGRFFTIWAINIKGRQVNAWHFLVGSAGVFSGYMPRSKIALDFLHSSVSKESACNAGDPGSIPGLGRSPGEENGNPLQYPCLENLMDRGAWWAAVHGVSKSRTWLSDFTFTFHFHTYYST